MLNWMAKLRHDFACSFTDVLAEEKQRYGGFLGGLAFESQGLL